MRKNRERILVAVMCMVFLFLVFPITANADIGPKASVRVNFENMDDEQCYGTLLSQKDSTGPQSAWDGNEGNIHNNDLDLEIWRAFAEYEDTDGYYFLQIGWKVSETKEIAWTYFPPDSFKILLYYPESGRFLVSDIYEQYAFDTYYTVDMNETAQEAVDDSASLRLEAYRSYKYKEELISLFARILLTILLEMIVGILFGFVKKEQFLLLIKVNVLTQVILNVLLNVANYHSGQWAFILYYWLFEIIVFIMEAWIYNRYMNRWTVKTKTPGFYVTYSLIANAVSFASGFYIAKILPGIF